MIGRREAIGAIGAMLATGLTFARASGNDRRCGSTSAQDPHLPQTSTAESPATETPPCRSMDDFLWRHRPLLVFAPSANAPILQAQTQEIAASAADLAERDIVVLAVAGDHVILDGTLVSEPDQPGLSAKSLRRRYDVPQGSQQALLVGKDGGVKVRRDGAIPRAILFDTIDAMPMRRREMGVQD